MTETLTSNRLTTARGSAQPVKSRNLMQRTVRPPRLNLSIKTSNQELKVAKRKFETLRTPNTARKSFMDNFRTIRH